MTPGRSRAFFAAFTLLSVAVTANALRQPPRATALALSPVTGAKETAPKPAQEPVAAAAAANKPALQPAAQPSPTPRTDTAKNQSAPAEPTKSIVLGKVSEPVRLEGRLPPASVVGQLPLPAVVDADTATVTSIQKALVDNGFGPQIVNGIAGPLTRAGILAYEQEHGLTLTGEATELLLRRVRREIPLPSPRRDTDTRRITTQEAEHVVLIVQKWLQLLGYGPARIDGRLGTDTSAAIRAFETDSKVTATGRVSAELFSSLARTVGAKTSTQTSTE